MLTISESLQKRWSYVSLYAPARKLLHDIRQLDEEKKETGSHSGRGTHARNRYVSLNSTAILLTSCVTARKTVFASLVLSRGSRAVLPHHRCPCYFECHRVYKRGTASSRDHVRETPSARATLLSLQFTCVSRQQILFPSK